MKDRCVHNLALHGDRGHGMIDVRCHLENGHDGDHRWGKEVYRGLRGVDGSYGDGVLVEVMWTDAAWRDVEAGE